MSADTRNDPDRNRPQAPAAPGTKRPDAQTERDRNPPPRRDAQGQIIEVPGRPDADEETNRDKAYGPGGARPAMDGGPTDEDAPDEAGDAQRGTARTGQGADTKPM